ncbi:MAG: hypothetical protein NG747_06670 [Candidatus Brocadia sp.]|nr:hypothetical protein [Candidatus Brocadia sp.]
MAGTTTPPTAVRPIATTATLTTGTTISVFVSPVQEEFQTEGLLRIPLRQIPVQLNILRVIMVIYYYTKYHQNPCG